MKRKITGEESIFLRAPEANVSLIAKIRGNVKEAVVKTALVKLFEVHPLLNTHVMIDKNDDIWLESNENIKLDLKILSKVSDNQWMKVIQEEFKVPFQLEKGPLIRFILLKSTQTSDLIIFCQHIICDGLSLANFVNEVLTLMENPDYNIEIEHNVCLPIQKNIKLTKKNILKDIIQKIIFKYIYYKWKKVNIDFNNEDFLQIHKSFVNKFNYEIIVTEFDENNTKKLVEVCRNNEVTLNSAISVAYLAARKDIMVEYQNDIQGIAVNIRDRLSKPVGNAFGCFVSDVGFKFKYEQKLKFWDNVRIYHKSLKNELKNYKDLKSLNSLSKIDCKFMEALTFARHVNYNVDYFKNDDKLYKLTNNKNIVTRISKEGLKEYPGLLITNLGARRYSDVYGELKLDRLYFAPSSIPTPDGGLIIGAVSMNNRLSITMNITSLYDNKELLKIMNEINNNATAILKDKI